MENRVVITGSGLVCSLGSTESEVWSRLVAGEEGTAPVGRSDCDSFHCPAARTERFSEANPGIQQRLGQIMDTHLALLMKAVGDAVLGSGLNAGDIPADQRGFFAGMGMVDYEVADLLPAVLESLGPAGELDYNRFYSQGYTHIYPLWPLAMLNNIAFCQVGIRYDIRGENCVFSPYADSGLYAIAEGYRTVKEGRAKLALCGGVSDKISASSLARAVLSQLLDSSGDGARCRPFSIVRKGSILGEGCGIVAVELLSHAAQRKAVPLAEVLGFGSASDGEGELSHPGSDTISQAMCTALDQSGIKPSDIDLLIAHADGNPAGDEAEMEAIHTVFSGCFDRLMVYSSKGALGHMSAAAPAVDTLIGINCMRNGMVPPTLHADPVDHRVRFDLVAGECRPSRVRRCLINSRSHEGRCASLVIGSCG
ncbi:MAG: hypothetical protein HPY84_03870 [Syntrophobacteraceae bacterium]|nr:hypothetical protein [Syntrophobacteraceae bacterium]